VIRLRSGESNLLAGLIRRDKTEGKTETPGLSAIPLIGRLFTNKSVQSKTVDLVLTLTPHIIRFPDIEEEDLAPVWVGTESRISFSGSRSPRVQSGRTTTGPFDETEEQERPQTARPRRSGTSSRQPFGAVRRATPPPQEDVGVELAPDSSKSLEMEQQQQEDPLYGEIDPDRPPVVVGLEPSVVSLVEGAESVLQLVAENVDGPYRLPIGLSFDPQRLAVESFEPAPGVQILDGYLNETDGWLSLDLLVTGGRESTHAVAAVSVRALSPGGVTMLLSSSGAIAGNGTTIPVATNDGALYVARHASSREEP
jgi:general secretion pathway protein D